MYFLSEKLRTENIIDQSKEEEEEEERWLSWKERENTVVKEEEERWLLWKERENMVVNTFLFCLHILVIKFMCVNTVIKHHVHKKQTGPNNMHNVIITYIT